ncbi:PIG-L family deacetylase [Limnochorda pilosa]|uniref:PIG-L family deacetylase n=1 Tax=Limnochorda pilosa TaxID=1555112 RepID=UPI0038B24CD2
MLSPHPDDAEYGSGGLLAGLRELDMEAHIACFVPTGELEDAPTLSETASIRQVEARASAELLGAMLHWLEGAALPRRPDAAQPGPAAQGDPS